MAEPSRTPSTGPSAEAGTAAPDAERPAAARAAGLGKRFGAGETSVQALQDVTVEFRSGEFTAIMGPSGSGKSTLMHVMAGLDGPTEGEVWIGGTALAGLKDKALTALRRDAVGFVFQQFNLLPTLTARENITLPLDIAGRSPSPGGSRRSSRRSGSGTGSATARPSCPGASSSGWPAHAPWSAGPRWSSPTSPPATSTPRRAPRCSRCCSARCASSARPS